MIAVVVVAVVVIAISGVATAAVVGVPSTTKAQALHRDLALLGHIPDQVRPTCLLSDTSYNSDDPGGHFVAELECHPDAATTITYRQYATRAEVAATLDRVSSSSSTSATPSTACGGRRGYRIKGSHVGDTVCGLDSGKVRITWSFDPLQVIGVLERSDGDVSTANASWTQDAGPDQSTHPVPSVLSGASSRRAGRALLAEIPDTPGAVCRATDLSNPTALLRGSPIATPSIWLDAEVVCSSDGVPADATYRRYRNGDAYAAAYDPSTFLRYANAEDPACPSGYESGWKVGNGEVGRVACYGEGVAPTGEGHLLWTYDPQHIVGEAFALNQTSAQAIYDWWTASAGPVPPR